jgi:hypothetical protein
LKTAVEDINLTILCSIYNNIRNTKDNEKAQNAKNDKNLGNVSYGDKDAKNNEKH